MSDDQSKKADLNNWQHFQQWLVYFYFLDGVKLVHRLYRKTILSCIQYYRYRSFDPSPTFLFASVDRRLLKCALSGGFKFKKRLLDGSKSGPQQP